MTKALMALGMLALFSSTASADPYTISNTYLYMDLNDVLVDGASNVDQMTLAGSADNYDFTGTIRLRPAISATPGNGATPAPFGYVEPLFLDLTNMTITCTLGTGVSCGGFDIDFVISFDVTGIKSNPLPILSTLEGTAPAGFTGSYDSAIDVFDATHFRIDDYFVTGNVTASGTALSQQLFAGSLNTTGATNIVFTGNFQSAAGLTGGQSVNLPSSFTTILGPAAIPEPGTVWMLLGGAAALGWLKRHKA
ncbi:MAG: PEP-CTERM sorting domain-containing protein [Acidobacteria bacterium]|nr:PEP-CTERM sorting domain-containing protein [Acidobacteriota bacterium]